MCTNVNPGAISSRRNSLPQLKAMQAAIQGKTVMKEEFRITQSREYGASYACVALSWQRSICRTGLLFCTILPVVTWRVNTSDRGMVTQSNHKKIDHELVKVIWVLSHGTIKQLCEKAVIQLGMFDEKNIVEVIENNIRYCLCKNPDMAKKESSTRQALLKRTTDELDKIVNSTRKTKYSKEIRAGKAVGKYNMGKFVLFEGGGDDLKYKLDKDKIAQESALDGCYIIYTDVPEEDMTAVQTVQSYKSLIQVEQAFRNMKTVQLEVRPVYHKKDDRIRCHVFICMLAYYVMWNMNQRLQPLFEGDGQGKDRKYTFQYIIENLKSIRKENVDFMGAGSSIITQTSEEQNQILNLLQVSI